MIAANLWNFGRVAYPEAGATTLMAPDAQITLRYMLSATTTSGTVTTTVDIDVERTITARALGIGTPEDGKLLIQGRRAGQSYEGFFQAWTDKENLAAGVVETDTGATYDGTYELTGFQLKGHGQCALDAITAADRSGEATVSPTWDFYTVTAGSFPSPHNTTELALIFWSDIYAVDVTDLAKIASGSASGSRSGTIFIAASGSNAEINGSWSASFEMA